MERWTAQRRAFEASWRDQGRDQEPDQGRGAGWNGGAPAAAGSAGEAAREAAFARWLTSAHAAQRPPGAGASEAEAGDAGEGRRGWSTWLFLGGRGAGKTRAGAQWLAHAARPGARLALVGPTLHEVREVMIEGESGLIATAAPGLRPRWEAGRGRLVWPNGAVAHAYSAEAPEALRGPQHHAAWADEFCAWRRAEGALANLRLGLRLGRGPQLVVTTTPRPILALRRLRAEPGLVETRAGTASNAGNLSPGFVEGLQALYGGTRLAAQELEGQVLDAAGALFPTELLAQARLAAGEDAGPFERVVVAVDPPAGGGDGEGGGGGSACGIVVAGLGGGTAVVLADRSAHGLAPAAWAARAAAAAEAFGAQELVAEANQGGEMVRAVLRAAGVPCPVSLVRARLGKAARAEPVAALYDQGRVRHAGVFPELEEELMALGADSGAKNDRADALVWAVTTLLVQRHQPRITVF